MPRNYNRKAPHRSVVTSDQFDAAKRLIAEGLSKRKAAEQVGMKESTLRKRLKSNSIAVKLGRFSLTFTNEQEDEIYNYLKRCDDLYYGLNMTTLRTLIYEYAEINHIPHRFNKKLKMAGRDWVYGFFKRHPDLNLRQPTQTSIARAMGFNCFQVNQFYDNLQSLQDKYKFKPSRIYNMDESGINTVPKKIPKVISIKGKKLVGKIVSAERGQTITLVCAMSATGSYVPPAFIFPRKKMKGHLLNNAPPGSIGMVSDSGFINTNLFLEYLSHFKDNVQPTKENPVLLILDNHSSHLSLAAVNFCRKNGIYLLTLPPHSSHKMQPLDRGFFGPLKTKFAYECDKWLSSNPGRVIGQTEVAQLVNEAFKKVATVNNATSGFKTSGVWPIDREIFSEEDFAAASVTDINLPSTSSEKNSSQNITATISSTLSTSESLHEYTPLSTIKPFPKAKEQTRRRKGKKSVIATNSPFKNELEKKRQEEEEKIAKKKRRLELKELKQVASASKTKISKKKTK